MPPQPARIHLAEASRMYTRRLQGIMSRLQRYDYMKCGTNRGENLHPADTLPRAYLPTTAHPTGAEFEHINTTAFLPMSTLRLQEIQEATESDEALRILILHDGHNTAVTPQVPSKRTPHFCMRDELTILKTELSSVDNASSFLSAYDVT